MASPAAADVRGAAYTVVALGGWSGWQNSGLLFGGAGGAEAVIDDTVGAGAELGMFGSGRGGLFSLSGGLSVRIPRETSHTVPFVGAGYSSLFFFEGNGDHALYLSGGFDHGISGRRALRVEFRDIIRPVSVGAAHYWALRVGVTFR